jgi:hypothetical protein
MTTAPRSPLRSPCSGRSLLSTTSSSSSYLTAHLAGPGSPASGNPR